MSTLDPVVSTLVVPCPVARAFDVFVRGMPRWWPLHQRSVSMLRLKKPSRALHVDARVGGEIREIDDGGGEHLWGTFTALEAPRLVRMDFHMGLPKETASVVEVTFDDVDGTSTRVTLTQSNWEAFGDLAEAMRGGYGSSWRLIFSDGYGVACGLGAAPSA